MSDAPESIIVRTVRDPWIGNQWPNRVLRESSLNRWGVDLKNSLELVMGCHWQRILG